MSNKIDVTDLEDAIYNLKAIDVFLMGLSDTVQNGTPTDLNKALFKLSQMIADEVQTIEDVYLYNTSNEKITS